MRLSLSRPIWRLGSYSVPRIWKQEILKSAAQSVAYRTTFLATADTLQHLLQLLPPHASEAPQTPSPYLYLAQSANDPQEALGYYTTAVALLEKSLKERDAKGKSRAMSDAEEDAEEEKEMAVTAIVAMIEIWMSDLWYVLSSYGIK